MIKIWWNNVRFLCILQVYESADKAYLVLELCRGGELLDRILDKKHFSEREAAEVMFVVATTVQHLHANGVTIFI